MPVVDVAETLVPAVFTHEVFTGSATAPQGLSLTRVGSYAQMLKVPVADPFPQKRT